MDRRHGVQEEAHHTAGAAVAGILVVAAEDIAQAAVLRMAVVLGEDHIVLGAVVVPIAAGAGADLEGGIDRSAGHHTAADQEEELHTAVVPVELHTAAAAEVGHIVVAEEEVAHTAVAEEGIAGEGSPEAGDTVDSALAVAVDSNLVAAADID